MLMGFSTELMNENENYFNKTPFIINFELLKRQKIVRWIDKRCFESIRITFFCYRCDSHCNLNVILINYATDIIYGIQSLYIV